MDETNIVFLSYASPDRNRVLEYYDYLANHGFNVWMDKHRLKAGQNWHFEISRALQKSTIVIVFVSENSVDRRGYAQREIKIALDQSRDRLVDDIYLIPVMLDSSANIPDQLRSIQAVRADDADPKAALADAINSQLDRLGVETARVQREAKLWWKSVSYKDVWEGLPGYDTTYQLLQFGSQEYPRISEITDVVRGWLQAEAMTQRDTKFFQYIDMYNFGQDRSARQNSWDVSCGEPRIKERFISILYSVWWFGARAAHPNQNFRSFVFTLDPITQVTRLDQIFKEPDEAFKVIQEDARSQLLARTFDEATEDSNEVKLDHVQVEDGTKDWNAFSNFVFNDDGIEILFSTYQVAAYVFGPQSATISYKRIAKLVHEHYASALGIEYL